METLVLISGYMCNEKMWHKQLKKKYKVVIPDLTKGKSIDEFSANTLKSLPDTFSILGFSIG